MSLHRNNEITGAFLPAGLSPPVLAGVARPPRPRAASPAKGLLPSLPICNNDEEIHRSTKARGKGRARAVAQESLECFRGYTKTPREIISKRNSINNLPASSRVSHSRISV